MNLAERLTERFVDKLASSPRGRAHVLHQAADAEDSDEGELFRRLLSYVEDEELARMIRRHEADEKEHARLFRACVARQGFAPPPVPEHLKLLHRIDHALGRKAGEAPKIESREDVMRTYLVLQVIEERATNQFELFERNFRRHDAESADVFARVIKDEERHLRYCHAIARRYAPDPETHARVLAELRTIEARCCSENSRANLVYVLEHGIVDAGPVDKLFWRGVSRTSNALGVYPRTAFWGTPPAQAPSAAVLAAA